MHASLEIAWAGLNPPSSGRQNQGIQNKWVQAGTEVLGQTPNLFRGARKLGLVGGWTFHEAMTPQGRGCKLVILQEGHPEIISFGQAMPP